MNREQHLKRKKSPQDQLPLLPQQSLRHAKRPKIDQRSPNPQPERPWWAINGFESYEEAENAFFNALPRILLSKRALEELDRRNSRRAHQDNSQSVIPRRLTRSMTISGRRLNISQVQRSAKLGGPDLTDLHGCLEPCPFATLGLPPYLQFESGSRYVLKMPSPQAQNGDREHIEGQAKGGNAKVSQQSTKFFDANGGELLIRNGIIPYISADDLDNPLNHSEILNKFREAVSEPDSRKELKELKHRFNQIRAEIHENPSHEAVTDLYKSCIHPSDDIVPRLQNKRFLNIAQVMEDPGPQPKPDYAEGLNHNQLGSSFRSQQEYKSILIPIIGNSMAVPNFFAEFKSLESSELRKGARQLAYYGVVGVRALQLLRTMKPKVKKYDKKAYTFGVLYDGRYLVITSMYPLRDLKNGGTLYVSKMLRSYLMSDNFETYREGVIAVRTVVRLARGYREQFLKEARQHIEKSLANQNPSPPVSVGDEDAQESFLSFSSYNVSQPSTQPGTQNSQDSQETITQHSQDSQRTIRPVEELVEEQAADQNEQLNDENRPPSSYNMRPRKRQAGEGKASKNVKQRVAKVTTARANPVSVS